MISSDVVARVARFNEGREPERLALKYRALRESPFRFFRGTAHLFWEDWTGSPTELDAAPIVWSTGDLHLENFGSYLGDNRLAYFDLNDFDEAALAPAMRDPARFLTSVHLAADLLELSRSEQADLCQGFLTAYADALVDGKARWVERATASGMVRDLLRRVKLRKRKALLGARTQFVGEHRRLKIDGRHALAVSRDDRRRISACLAAYGKSHDDPGFFDVLDAARRIAGTGSLGMRRFVVLVRGRGSPDGNFLLDLKEAVPSSLAAHQQLAQPAWRDDAHRVVGLQRRIQAIAPALLRPVVLDRRHFIMRELQPIEDHLALAHWNGKLRRLRRVMATMGHLTAWAQLRSASREGAAGADDLIVFARSRSWRRALIARAREYALHVRHDWEQFVRETHQH